VEDSIQDVKEMILERLGSDDPGWQKEWIEEVQGLLERDAGWGWRGFWECVERNLEVSLLFRISCSSDFLRRQAFLLLGDQSYEPSTCLLFSIIHGGCSYPRGRLISSAHHCISMKKAGKLVMGISTRPSPASAREKSGRSSMKSERL